MPIERSDRWSRWVSMVSSGKIAAWLPWYYYCCLRPCCCLLRFLGLPISIAALALSPLRELDGYDRDGGRTEMYKVIGLNVNNGIIGLLSRRTFLKGLFNVAKYIIEASLVSDQNRLGKFNPFSVSAAPPHAHKQVHRMTNLVPPQAGHL